MWSELMGAKSAREYFLIGRRPGRKFGKGFQRRPQKRFNRRLEEVVKAVGGGYCRLQMPLKLALGVRDSAWA